MEKMTTMTMDHFLFSGEIVGAICTLTFKKMPLLHVADLEAKQVLFQYLDLISNDDDIKILLIKSAPVKMERAEFISYYEKMFAASIAKSTEHVCRMVMRLLSRYGVPVFVLLWKPICVSCVAWQKLSKRIFQKDGDSSRARWCINLPCPCTSNWIWPLNVAMRNG